jgi:hypothetical protein
VNVPPGVTDDSIAVFVVTRSALGGPTDGGPTGGAFVLFEGSGSVVVVFTFATLPISLPLPV